MNARHARHLKPVPTRSDLAVIAAGLPLGLLFATALLVVALAAYPPLLLVGAR